MNGFTSYEGNAVLWVVYHDKGTTFVRATTESIALARFMAKYPDYKVAFSNLLSDPNYRVRYSLGKDNQLFMIEVCYSDDFKILT